MLWFFLWVAWIVLLFRVFADIFRSADMSGLAKAGWVFLTVLVPFIGVLIYLLARGDSMAQRDLEMAEAQEEMTRQYIREAAGSPSKADELAKLAGLRDQGVLTEEEFRTQKAALLM